MPVDIEVPEHIVAQESFQAMLEATGIDEDLSDYDGDFPGADEPIPADALAHATYSGRPSG
eukprot:4349736-Prymnesium_polylepis.1